MYKYLLESVDGIQWFGVASLLLFFCTFCFVSIRAMLFFKKDELEHVSHLPLED